MIIWIERKLKKIGIREILADSTRMWILGWVIVVAQGQTTQGQQSKNCLTLIKSTQKLGKYLIHWMKNRKKYPKTILK